jgi:hypothetical protein
MYCVYVYIPVYKNIYILYIHSILSYLYNSHATPRAARKEISCNEPSRGHTRIAFRVKKKRKKNQECKDIPLDRGVNARACAQSPEDKSEMFGIFLGKRNCLPRMYTSASARNRFARPFPTRTMTR